MTDPKFHGFCLGVMFCACVLAFLFVCASIPQIGIGGFANWGGFWLASLSTLGGAGFLLSGCMEMTPLSKVESMAAALYAEYYQITWAEALVSLQSGVEVGDEFRRLAQIAIDHMDYIKDLPDDR